MNKKILFLIFLMVVILIYFVSIFYRIKEHNKHDIDCNTEIIYNDETGMYYIKDKTGRILHQSEDEANLHIYTIDPEYDPKNADYININVNN